jgi:hypothetical protein
MTNLIPFLIIILFVSAGTIILRTASANEISCNGTEGQLTLPTPYYLRS